MPENQKESITQSLRDETAKTLVFFRELPSEQWTIPIYTSPHVWTIRDLIIHFVDTDPILRRVVQDILAGGPGAPENADVDGHNAEAVPRRREEFAAKSNTELIDLFESQRAKLITVVEGMSDADFERQGRHPLLGIMPLSELIRVIYLHNKAHQRDIRRALATFTAQRTN